MTDREFDELLKTAFDRYAKQTLSKIPENIPEIPDRPKTAARRSQKKRNAALVLLSAACVGLLALCALLIAKIAGQDMPSPLPTLPVASHGTPDSPSSTLSPTVQGPATEAERSPATAVPSGTAAVPEGSDPNSDTVTEQIYPDFFHSFFNGQSSSGDTGEFADPALIGSELPELKNTVHTDEIRSFDKRTGGSFEFWNGEVQVFLQYENPVLPIAISYTFENPDLLPRSCILMGQSADGSWVELQSYTCKISRKKVTVAFYLDPEDPSDNGARFTDFCLSYHYIAMPDENYEIPQAKLYGFEDRATSFLFAKYYVSGGTLFAVATNAAELTLPADFGGSPLQTVRRSAIAGDLAPALAALTVPEGVQTIESGAIVGCAALQSVFLPSTLTLPIPVNSGDPEFAEFAEEIRRDADLNGDGFIGAPLSAILRDCGDSVRIGMAESHPLS